MLNSSMAVASCVIGAAGAANIATTALSSACTQDPYNCDDSTINSIGQSTQAMCNLLACLPPSSQANVNVAAIRAACSVGMLGARIIMCRSSKAACINELANLQPILPMACPTSMSSASVQACGPNGGVRDLNAIQQDCSRLTQTASLAGTQVGACNALCASNTMAASVNCRPTVMFTPAPVATPLQNTTSPVMSNMPIIPTPLAAPTLPMPTYVPH